MSLNLTSRYRSLSPILTLHQNWFPNTHFSGREVFNTKRTLNQTQTHWDSLTFSGIVTFLNQFWYFCVCSSLKGFLTGNECSRSWLPLKKLVPVRLIAVITASSHSCPIFWVDFSHNQRSDQPSKTNSTCISFCINKWIEIHVRFILALLFFFSGNTFCAKSWKNRAKSQKSDHPKTKCYSTE